MVTLCLTFWGNLCHFNPHITKFGWLLLSPNVLVSHHYSQWHPTKGTLSRITFMASFLVSLLSPWPYSVSSFMLCKICFLRCESHGHLIVLKTKQNTNPSKACHCPLDTGLTKALCCPASDLLSALGCMPPFVLASSWSPCFKFLYRLLCLNLAATIQILCLFSDVSSLFRSSFLSLHDYKVPFFGPSKLLYCCWSIHHTWYLPVYFHGNQGLRFHRNWVSGLEYRLEVQLLET